MPDIGWMELLVIGIVALIVVGPKDLPVMFRKLGQFTGRIKGMARDFQRAMDDAARESGMEDVKRGFDAAAKYSNPRKAGMDAIRDTLGDTLDDIDPNNYEDGSATQKLAKKKAMAQKDTREAIEARNAKRAAAQAAAAKAEEEAAAAATPAPEADAKIEPELPPARTGTDAT